MRSDQHKNRGSCRIIGGLWRSRRIAFHPIDGLRPSPDRVRETVFNWLQPLLSQWHCLDLYAGSGVLGFEALSRGAAHVDFIETHAKQCQKIQSSIDLLNAAAEIYKKDAIKWLRMTDKQYHLIFIDPPFEKQLWQASIDLINDNRLIVQMGLVYVETPVLNPPILKIPSNWIIYKQNKMGNVQYTLYQLNDQLKH